jgi:hypothetical protein
MGNGSPGLFIQPLGAQEREPLLMSNLFENFASVLPTIDLQSRWTECNIRKAAVAVRGESL